MWGAEGHGAHNDAAGSGLYKYPGVRARPANNRGNDDGGTVGVGGGKAGMIPSMTIAAQAVGGGGAEESLGIVNQTRPMALQCRSHTKGRVCQQSSV